MIDFNMSIRSFIEKAASNSSTPGGGSVAAVAAALGASMGAMAACLSTGKRFQEVSEEMDSVAATMREASDTFEKIMIEDIESFQGFMKAYGLPKDTAEDKLIREAAIKEAARSSAEVPLTLMKVCCRLLEEISPKIDKTNKNLLSDLGICAVLLDASVQSAWLTIGVNLKSLGDSDLAKNFEHEGKRFAMRSKEISTQVTNKIWEITGQSNLAI